MRHCERSDENTESRSVAIPASGFSLHINEIATSLSLLDMTTARLKTLLNHA